MASSSGDLQPRDPQGELPTPQHTPGKALSFHMTMDELLSLGTGSLQVCPGLSTAALCSTLSAEEFQSNRTGAYPDPVAHQSLCFVHLYPSLCHNHLTGRDEEAEAQRGLVTHPGPYSP